ncbi:hypothetical protein [Paenisporosarcina sp. TG20]|uniref:hypothetical protein n=1 Tax=Paenisporosarcina sp. TG20 TaxID=1211706 RepID=UPI0002FBF50C|nr:hypothetical protein [Paenisporosarcina sp. TG20]
MDIFKKIKEIENHFHQITDEKYEKNLISAGFGEIEHSNQSQMQIITVEFQQKANEVTYSAKKSNYNFEKLPNMITENVLWVAS